MKKITNEDKLDNLLSAGTLAEAESLFARAELVIKLRRKMDGTGSVKRGRPRKSAEKPPDSLNLREPGK
jgi:hypothetical protein